VPAKACHEHTPLSTTCRQSQSSRFSGFAVSRADFAKEALTILRASDELADRAFAMMFAG